MKGNYVKEMMQSSGYSPIFNFILATILFILGQVLSWSSSYSQFVSERIKDNALLYASLMAIPSAVCFTYGIRLAYEFFGNGWAPRFYVFGISFLVYPAMFSYYMGESFFSYKNIICLILAIAIMLTQLFVNK